MGSFSNSIIFFALPLFFFSDHAHALTLGTRNKRIVDPESKTDSYFEHIRHQVMLVKNDRPYCSGTIIDDRFILTAAHCVIDERTHDFKDEPIEIIAGTNTLYDSDYRNRIYRYVEEIVVPVRYVQPERGYDIAILKLSRGFGPNSKLERLSVPDLDEPFDDVIAEVSGIGTEEIDYSPHNRKPIQYKSWNLRYQDVDVLSQRRCAEIWGNAFVPHQICGRLYGSFTRRGVCKGDSGSGLSYKGKVIGVVSYGHECNEGPGGRPTLYTKVSYFSDIILSFVIDDFKDYNYVRARRYRVNEKFL